MAERSGASDRAFQKIIGLVLSHELKPGDRIYETNLAEELDMSRTPVREALTRLASTGFIEKMPKQKGYLIPTLSPDDMEQIYYMRITLEGKAARIAARIADKRMAETLTRINEEEKKRYLANEKDEYAALNEKFHMAIAKMSGNTYLYRYIQQLFWRSNLYVFFFMSFYNLAQLNKVQPGSQIRLSYEEHHKIVEAITANDPVAAEKAMQEHLVIAYNSMLNPQKSPHMSFGEFDM